MLTRTCVSAILFYNVAHSGKLDFCYLFLRIILRGGCKQLHINVTHGKKWLKSVKYTRTRLRINNVVNKITAI